MEIVTAGVADQPRARAITAIARAAVRHQKQHAVGIAMDQSGHGRVGILAARVAHFPRRGVRFGDLGNDLQPHRTMFVRRINQVEEIRRDGQCEFGVRQFRAGKFLRRERGQESLQLLRRCDAVFELPAPVIPIGVGNIVPEAAPGGVKFLERSGVGGPPAAPLRRPMICLSFILSVANYKCGFSPVKLAVLAADRARSALQLALRLSCCRVKISAWTAASSVWRCASRASSFFNVSPAPGFRGGFLIQTVGAAAPPLSPR